MSNAELIIQTTYLRKLFQQFTVKWNYTGVPLYDLSVELEHIPNIKAYKYAETLLQQKTGKSSKQEKIFY
jgi:hypothetical protein